MTQVQKSPLELEIEKRNEELKALKAQLKELNKKEKTPQKGVPMKWTNKKGVEIKGMATTYYCITVNGVTHLKATDSPDIVKLEKL